MFEGRILDEKYRLEENIGSGGMGVVYAATCLQTHQRVAIKLLNTDPARSAEIAAKRLQRESRLVKQLAHPNICGVIDDGFTENGTPYMVMPLLTGEPLMQKIKREGIQSVEDTVDICAQVLSALETTHAHKIVHRDLKPENIFITTNQDPKERVKLLDFGISKVHENTASTTEQLTVTGKIVGTICYMSPERLGRSKDADHRVDIYSMGVILYQMLTGKLPYEGSDDIDTIDKIRYDSFPAPRAINKTIPRLIEQIIITAMAKDATKRFDSAAEMRELLMEAVSDPATSGTSDNVFRTKASVSCAIPVTEPKTRRTRRPSRFRRIAVPAVFVLSAVVVSMIYLQSGFEKKTDEPSRQPPDIPSIPKHSDKTLSINNLSDREPPPDSPKPDGKAEIGDVAAPPHILQHTPSELENESNIPSPISSAVGVQEKGTKTDQAVKRAPKPGKRTGSHHPNEETQKLCNPRTGTCLEQSPTYPKVE